MKRKILFGLGLIALILIGACAKDRVISPQAKMGLLRTQTLKWENFPAEGIAEMKYMGISLRKMFVLNKTKEGLRIDIIDGGILGMGASPLISVYLGEYFSLQSDFQPQLALMASSMINPDLSLGPLSDLNALVDAFGESIVETGKLQKDGAEIVFTPQYQLQSIVDGKSKAQINVSYTSKGQPDIISFTMKDASVDLLCDKVQYGKAEVTPLPRMAGNILNQFLEPNPYREVADPEEHER